MEKVAKEELSQIYYLNKELRMWQKELERLESQSLVKGQQITGMPSGGSRTTSKVEERALRVEEIREHIQSLRDRAEREQIRLLNYIESIEDSYMRQIIEYRFKDLMSWKNVAQKMGIGYTSDSIRMSVDRYLKK